MEKHFTCVGCSRNFSVLSRPDKPTHQQHEVEMNVECPFCSRTNPIVWPQDESLPLVLPIANRIRVQILEIAKELIGGRVDVIAASRELSRFRHDVEPQLAEILLTSTGIDSDTGTLPIGTVRKEWNRDALERMDREIAEVERLYRDSAMSAAAELIRLLDVRS